jgi:acetyl esterase/lipase
VPATDAGPEVTVRVTQRQGRNTGRAGVLWIHGGGYLFGTALADDARINRWVDELDCVVIGVEYRLAPEHPYPAPLDDCYRALAWMVANADELGIDRERVVVVGQSAGGGLAAGLCLLARDRGEIDIAYQLLIYPMIDDRNTSVSSQIVGAPIWSRAANLLGWKAYLGREPGGDDVPAYAAASRATDLGGLPPTFLCVGTIDLFRDETIDYAQRLLHAQVPTELHVYPGAPHGFETMAAGASTIARRALRDIDEALASAVNRPGAA